MMQTSVSEPGIAFNFVPTPWDNDLLGGTTGFIKINKYDTESNQSKRIFNEWIHDNEIVYCGLKVDPENLILKKWATILGFYFVNSTCEVFKRNLQNLPNTNSKIFIRHANESDYEKILSNNLNNMIHGRFHEDYNFRNLVEKRQKIILKNQFESDEVFFSIGELENNFVGYSIFKKNKNAIELLHMGVDGDVLLPTQAIRYWEAVFKYMRDNLNAKRISGRLTLTNTAAVSIYSNLQFMFHRPLDEFALIRSIANER